MSALPNRVAAIAEAARRRAIDSAASRITDAVPEANVTVIDDGVVLAGRGLRRRLLGDGRLRWISEILR